MPNYVELLTVGTIVALLAAVVSIWKNFDFLNAKKTEIISNVVKEQLNPLSAKIDKIENKIDLMGNKVDKVDKNATMNYLVRCIDDIERGETLDKAAKQRFYDQYEHYIKDLNGNTYIKESVDALKRKHLL